MCVRLQIRTCDLKFVCDLMFFLAKIARNDYEFTEKEEKIATYLFYNRYIPFLYPFLLIIRNGENFAAKWRGIEGKKYELASEKRLLSCEFATHSLQCFGVNSSFIVSFRNYLTLNCMKSIDLNKFEITSVF